MAATRVFETTAKSVLSKSKIPGLDYAVNPYVGCEHACTYCYATFMKKFLRIPDEWGEFVGVKVNAAEVLGREARKKAPGVVTFGTVCDPYQDVEREYRITRACLEVFSEVEGFDVGVLTKSDLVARDVDVLSHISGADVGLTITTLAADVAGVLEPGAPPPARRLAAMRELASAGIGVWAFFGPVLPGLSDSEESVAEVLQAVSDAGASRVLVDRLNLYPKVWARLRPVLERRFPGLVDVVQDVRRDPDSYERELRARVKRAAAAVGLPVDVCF
ncbi:MAG: radical SAM protein [Candidatus Eisenbacteria bacterium]